jgi:formylglycine-generating enzyme required for sulfatase activity
MEKNPSYFRNKKNPVEQVSYDDVQKFIAKLNGQTGKNYRLPTEAEWEYAARGGNKSKGYKYSGSNTVGNVAWYDSIDDNKVHYSFSNVAKTHVVGSKSSKELGIYDMSGNVYEWCNDWYGNYNSEVQNNPKGASSGSSRVLRGGSWKYYSGGCRVSYRYYKSPDHRQYYIGFRLALIP